MRRTAAVIGAGFGGLALAIRLQSAGIATTLVEARERPGGRAYVRAQDGFTFDMGPTIIADPAGLKELWALSGRDMADDVTLLPVHPFYRLSWPDGASLDLSGDEAAMIRQIAAIEPRDAAGYTRLLAHAAEVRREGPGKRGGAPFPDFAAMVKAAPTLVRHRAWRSVHSAVAAHIRNERLRQAFSFHALLLGGNPMTAGGGPALARLAAKDGGIWFARGGTSRLVAAMATHFERLGGTLRVSDPVVGIETLGDRATGLRTASGWRGDFDAVATNADLVHSYRDLLAGTRRGPRAAEALARQRFSPSLFLVHFGIRGAWPGIPHHMMLFGPRYEGLLRDIFGHGLLAQDFALYLHHPTVTDPSLAPEGCSTFHALAPVPHLGKLPIDWDRVGPLYAERILTAIGKRLIPGLRERLVTRFHYGPVDFRRDLGAHLGSAFGLEPIPAQTLWARARHRDEVIPNLYVVGAGTHPGGGIPGAVASAGMTAGLMLEELRR